MRKIKLILTSLLAIGEVVRAAPPRGLHDFFGVSLEEQQQHQQEAMAQQMQMQQLQQQQEAMAQQEQEAIAQFRQQQQLQKTDLPKKIPK